MKKAGFQPAGSEFDLSDFLYDTYLKFKGKAPGDGQIEGTTGQRSSVQSNKINPMLDYDEKTRHHHSVFNGPREEGKQMHDLNDTEKVPIQHVIEEAESLNKQFMEASLNKKDTAAFKTLDQSAGDTEIFMVQEQLKFKKRAAQPASRQKRDETRL